MPVSAILGMYWGDEGKGKYVDEFAEQADIVVRCQGGANAGHTVVVGPTTYKLHLLPSGLLRDNVVGVIGNGVVADPIRLAEEIAGLEGRVQPLAGRFFISERAHLVTPFHKALDRASERALGKENIGTTGQGIGPAYTYKAMRRGLRWHMIRDLDAFGRRYREVAERANEELIAAGAPSCDIAHDLSQLLTALATLRPYVADTTQWLAKQADEGRRILLEGAQGAMLDVDFGTYPFVTSSNTTVGGTLTGSGLPPTSLRAVHGVLKAFTTRVGTGPFPTELDGELAAKLRGTGQNHWDEFGTTTGRPRRCGWIDLVVGRYSARLNGVTALHVTKADILSQFDEIKLCVAYELDGRRTENFPADIEDLERCKPVYETMPGWRVELKDMKKPSDLPPAARAYAERISSFMGVPMGSISYGPGRGHTVWY